MAPRIFNRDKERRPRFESRTEVWREVGLGSEVERREAHEAHRAQWGTLLVGALIAALLVVFSRQEELFPGLETEVRIVTVGALVILGVAFARNLGRGVARPLYRRLDPGAAGTIGFLIRLVTLGVLVVVALRIAGLNPGTLAVGGAFTAVILGLAAQQTIGNLFAGTVLLGTRPFRVGERVKLIGGVLAGQVDGIVGSLGLFYTTLISGADRIMVPNSVVIQSAVIPMREPERVELRARLGSETTPRQVQDLLEKTISVPLRYPPHVAIEELDRDEVVVRITSTPINPDDGAKLAEEVLAAVRRADHEPATDELTRT
ncbi:MAG: mechanosensitive ion channel family protein [Actinomycetota bacterium]|nr:mechanosensitive ion channel family protein [Actinomycetota bacterium]